MDESKTFAKIPPPHASIKCRNYFGSYIKARWMTKQKKRDHTVHSIFICWSLILLEIIRKEIEVKLKGLNFNHQ